MRGKIVFTNPESRLAAAYVGGQQYVVFEHTSGGSFKEGDIIENLKVGFGPCECIYESSRQRTSINILSSAMSYAKAKLVVAPWQDEESFDEENIA